MSEDSEWHAAPGPHFFDGRILINIQTWDWTLSIAVSEPSTPLKSRFQSGLDYGRDFHIGGVLRAPAVARGRTIELTLSPFGPKVVFGRNGLKQVGRLDVAKAGQPADFSATVMLPESAISSSRLS